MTTKNAPIQWDQAGLRTDVGLDRPIASDRWQVPAVVNHRSFTLRWSRDGARVTERKEPCLVWQAFDTVEEPRETRATPQLLEQFVGLVDASDDRICRYARRWGVLQLCPDHSLPQSHYPAPHAWIGNVHAGCRPLARDGWDGVEPLVTWRLFARRARALLHLAAALHLGHVGREGDWQAALEGWRDAGVDVLGRPFPVPWWKRSLPGDRRGVASLVALWLMIGDVRPRFQWSGPAVTMTIGGQCLAGALATQLVLAISRTEGFAICSSCGQAYIPTKRPAASRRRYCRECRRGGAPLRDAQRAHRARRNSEP